MPILGGALPDLDNNGTADVFEISGEIRPGLFGHGCMISFNDSRKDPMMLVLLAVALRMVSVRRVSVRLEEQS